MLFTTFASSLLMPSFFRDAPTILRCTLYNQRLLGYSNISVKYHHLVFISAIVTKYRGPGNTSLHK